MPKNSKGKAYDLCNKALSTRLKTYRKNSIKKQRANMCSPGYMPRCVKGLAYCAKKRSKRSYKTSSHKKMKYLK